MAKEVIEIYGLKIYTNTLYEVGEKLDVNAPSGFVERETTKALSQGIKNVENVAIYNEYSRTWDTGLFKESPLLSKAISNPTAREEAINKITEYIIEPIVNVSGDSILDRSNSNNDFWDAQTVDVYKGKVFNTEDPMQLFQLYSLMLRRVLTPKDQESNTMFLTSQYTILNKEEVVSKNEEKASRQMEAYGTYYGLKTTNKESLLMLMNFIGLQVSDVTSDTTLDLIFKNFIEDKKKSTINTTEFIKTAKEFTTAKGKSVVGIYNTLKELALEDKLDIRGKDIYFKTGEFLGNDFKSASRNLAENKDLKKVFVDLQK